MKNILLFSGILLLAACSKKTEIIPEVVPDPSLTLSISIDSVHLGESVVITCFTENAVRTSNNIGAPNTTNWTHTLTPIQTTTIEVTAFNTLEKLVTKTKTVTFLQWTKKDTMTNFLCSSPYIISKKEHEYVSGIWEEQPMTPLESRKLWLFDKNGTSKVWDPVDGRIIVENSAWYFTNDLKSLYYGGRTDEIILLNETTLVLGYWVQALDPQTGQWVNSFKGRRTYTHQ